MLEIIVSAVYVFGVATYIASSGTEAISSLIGFRAGLLFRSVEMLLNDKITGLAKAVYGNPLVHPRATENDPDALKKNLPSYIDPKNFADALIAALELKQSELDTLRPAPSEKDRVIGLKTIDDWLRTSVTPLREDARLRGLLASAIQASNADLAQVTDRIAIWYNQATQRIGGEYKRWTQLSNFLIALVIAVAFDLSPLPPAVTDETQASLVPGNGAPAIDRSAAGAVPSTPAVVGPPPAFQPVAQSGDQATPQSQASPPTDQVNGNGATKTNGWNWSSVRTYGRKLLGWLVIATSTLLGAPFWFGILSTVANLKSVGVASAAPTPTAVQSGSPPPGPGGATPPPDTPPPTNGGTPAPTPGGTPASTPGGSARQDTPPGATSPAPVTAPLPAAASPTPPARRKSRARRRPVIPPEQS